MDYEGKRVNHNSYGDGTIIFYDEEKERIIVEFDSNPLSTKTFGANNCFGKFLTFLDESIDVDEANRGPQKGSGSDTKTGNGSPKTTAIPRYSSVKEFCDEQTKELEREIKALRLIGEKRQKLNEGVFVKKLGDAFVYSFESDTELNYPDGTPITLYTYSNHDGYSAVLMNCEEFTVIIASGKYLGQSISFAEFSSRSWQLIQSLIERLDDIGSQHSKIVHDLIMSKERMGQIGKPFCKGQDHALNLSLNQPITFIWGPPGTGKTETLANIAIEHIRRGRRVLMLSYSNVSVDGATWRVFSKDKTKKPGTIVRYGYPKDKELLNHEFLTAYNLALYDHPDLVREKKRLEKERKELSRRSPRYVENGRELESIRNRLKDEEEAYVEQADFVATTVSKAVIDSTIYGTKFDTVIFDEASMAFVSQVIFSASLAKSSFICMGDFAQLPPIVQNNENSKLKMDIFEFCGIVRAVKSGIGHKWLCMLDVQHRMHPEIAEYASKYMYKGLLKSAPDMRSKRADTVFTEPLRGDPVGLIDLSGMMSVCSKNDNKSHVNVLSALVAMGLAYKAAEENEVGIITPYNAQARLLYSMSRDIAEKEPELKKITCATVHQFQGSEQDVIIYDAVDCYRMSHPGMMLTSTDNDYANRLYNVALTRAKGKIISVVNADYMKTKNLSKKLLFRKVIDQLLEEKKYYSKGSIFNYFGGKLLEECSEKDSWAMFAEDMHKAKTEIRIDIPGSMKESQRLYEGLLEVFADALSRDIQLDIRVEDKSTIPTTLRKYVKSGVFVTDPLVIIDKKISWFGMPYSNANFVAEGKKVKTDFRPIIRFEGKHFGSTLRGLLKDWG